MTHPATGSFTSRPLADHAATAAVGKQGTDTVLVDVSSVLAITDWFVITSGRNDRQVRTIAEEVEGRLRVDLGERPVRREGLDDARWILLDYGDVIVHVFLDETRRFYDLERLWADCPRYEVNDGPAARAASEG